METSWSPQNYAKENLEDDTGLEVHELQTVMLDRVSLLEEEFCHIDSLGYSEVSSKT